MSSEYIRRYMRLVEDSDTVLGYALRDQLGRFVSWKSGPGGDIKSGDHGISKSLRQMFPTKEAAESANNQRLENHRMMLEIWKKRQNSPLDHDQQIQILQKLIDTPVEVVAITVRPVA